MQDFSFRRYTQFTYGLFVALLIVLLGAWVSVYGQKLPPTMTICEDTRCDGGNGATIWTFDGQNGQEQADGQFKWLLLERIDPGGIVIRRQDKPGAAIGEEPYTLFIGHPTGDTVLGTMASHVSGHIVATGVWRGTVTPTTCNQGATIPQSKTAGASAAFLKQGVAALNCYLIAARQGDPEAQTLAGLLLREGIGVQHDDAAAFGWLSKAANAKYVKAERALADMYRLGLGTGKDSAKAALWSAKADQQERAQSQEETKALMALFNEFAPVIMGALAPEASGGANGPSSEESQGAAKSEVSARIPHPEKLPPDVRRCDPANPEHIGAADAFKRGKLANDAQVDKIAVCWFRIGASQNSAEANAYLGSAYGTGWGVEPNDKLAFSYMKKAAELGNLYGEAYLAEFYRTGFGNPGNWEQAKAWRDKLIKSPGGVDVWMQVRGTQASALQAGQMLGQEMKEDEIQKCTGLHNGKMWSREECIQYLR